MLKNGARKLENGAQSFCNKFDCKLFISKFSQFAFYLALSFSFITKSPDQPCCKCCNLSVSVVLNVRFTMNGMRVKNNTHIYVAQTSSNRMNTSWVSVVACCHSVKLYALAARPLRSQQSGALTSPVATGALVGLAPPKTSPSPSKLKYETL